MPCSVQRSTEHSGACRDTPCHARTMPCHAMLPGTPHAANHATPCPCPCRRQPLPNRPNRHAASFTWVAQDAHAVNLQVGAISGAKVERICSSAKRDVAI